MRIPHFSKIVRKHAIEETINGSTLVVDGQNFFYDCYENSSLTNQFGCESDNYFQVLKDNLKKFKMADVKCYFIFKGGHKDTETRALKARLGGANMRDFMAPIFMWDVHREILEEMGFQYAYGTFVSKPDIVAMAQQLQCPILSNDIEYCLAGVSYINRLDLHFDESTHTLKANVFRLDRFLAKTRLDKNKLAIFVVLFDEYIFPENHFSPFVRTVVSRTNYRYTDKYEAIFKWLSYIDAEVAKTKILRFSPQDRDTFMEKKDEVMNLIELQHDPGVASGYLLNGCRMEVGEKDPLWFEKGVAATITLPYVNLYDRDEIAGLAWIPMTSGDDSELENPLLLSSDIIRYAYDLLKNFPDTEFEIKSAKRSNVQWKSLHVQTGRIAKPEYEANESVFENGWEGIKELKLFEHFLIQQFHGFDFNILNHLPEEAKLLMISLLYFKRFSSSDQKEAIMLGVLFSYVSLGVINQEGNDANNNLKSSVTEEDKEVAKQELKAFCTAAVGEVPDINMIHSLIEYQHVLNNLKSLNKLCGSPYQPILISRMYNGALVYKVTRVDWSFLKSKLGRATTVLHFLNVLFNICVDFN